MAFWEQQEAPYGVPRCVPGSVSGIAKNSGLEGKVLKLQHSQSDKTLKTCTNLVRAPGQNRRADFQIAVHSGSAATVAEASCPVDGLVSKSISVASPWGVNFACG